MLPDAKVLPRLQQVKVGRCILCSAQIKFLGRSTDSIPDNRESWKVALSIVLACCAMPFGNFGLNRITTNFTKALQLGNLRNVEFTISFTSQYLTIYDFVYQSISNIKADCGWYPCSAVFPIGL
jgi:hypothetical protein